MIFRQRLIVSIIFIVVIASFIFLSLSFACNWINSEISKGGYSEEYAINNNEMFFIQSFILFFMIFIVGFFGLWGISAFFGWLITGDAEKNPINILYYKLFKSKWEKITTKKDYIRDDKKGALSMTGDET